MLKTKELRRQQKAEMPFWDSQPRRFAHLCCGLGTCTDRSGDKGSFNLRIEDNKTLRWSQAFEGKTLKFWEKSSQMSHLEINM